MKRAIFNGLNDGKNLICCLALSVPVIIVVLIMSKAKQDMPPMLVTGEFIAKSTSSSFWALSKHTVSIKSNTYLSVATFVNSYITDASEVYNLGCNDTHKVVGSLVVPASDVSNEGFEELHWVDSQTFLDNDFSIGNWSDYISETTGFNAFMHNKVQLFVPNLSPHYLDLMANQISITLRLSSSCGGEDLDTAHLSIMVEEASTIYEIVGPMSSLNSTQLENFDEWDDEECPLAHALPSCLATYVDLYDSVTYSESNIQWMASTGKEVPMGVAINTPTHEISYVTPTMKMIKDVTAFTFSTTTAGTCEMIEINFNSEAQFGPILRYVLDTSLAGFTDVRGTGEGARGAQAQGVEGGEGIRRRRATTKAMVARKSKKQPNDHKGGGESDDGDDDDDDDDLTHTVADWEVAVQSLHATYIRGGSVGTGISDGQWDRYLDTHLGFINTDSTACEPNQATIEALIESYADSYDGIVSTVRAMEAGGVHYYVGVPGLKAIELDLFGCNASYSDLCGCIDSNSKSAFEAIFNITCAT